MAYTLAVSGIDQVVCLKPKLSVPAWLAAIVRRDIAARWKAFAVDARIAHRLLSQRAGGHLDEQCAVATIDKAKDLLK